MHRVAHPCAPTWSTTPSQLLPVLAPHAPTHVHLQAPTCTHVHPPVKTPLTAAASPEPTYTAHVHRPSRMHMHPHAPNPQAPTWSTSPSQLLSVLRPKYTHPCAPTHIHPSICTHPHEGICAYRRATTHMHPHAPTWSTSPSQLLSVLRPKRFSLRCSCCDTSAARSMPCW
jgi:hypothetical protein